MKTIIYIVLNFLISTNLNASEARYLFEAGLSLSSFDYKEFSLSGNLLDRENGALPGLFFEAKSEVYPYQYSFKVTGQENTLNYSGKTQLGSALETRTLESIFQYSFNIKRHLFQLPYPTDLIVKLGERRWSREIYKTVRTNSLTEIYHWPYIMLGASFQISNDANKNVEFKVLFGKSFNAELDIYFEGYDKATLKLKQGDVLVIKMPLTIHEEKGYTVKIEPYYEYWHFEQSKQTALSINGFQSGFSANEPENETTLLGINVSFLF